jgi:hypothetical protein
VAFPGSEHGPTVSWFTDLSPSWGHIPTHSIFKRNECVKFGVEFSLQRTDVEPLPVRCPVLGLLINYSVTTGRPEDISPSIDRFNNSLGYVHGNVRVISNRANRLKSNGTREEHLKIATYMKGN